VAIIVVAVIAIYAPQLLVQAFSSASWGGVTFSALGTTTALGTTLSAAGVATVGAIAGFASGAIMTGSLKGAMQGAMWGAISAGVAFGIGEGLGHAGGILSKGVSSGQAFIKAAAHGLSRGIISVAQGGTFKSGFASGFASSFFSPGTTGKGGFLGRTSISAIVGGTASKIGGGKFSNGAVSGAFVHMFNAEGLAEMSSDELDAFMEAMDPGLEDNSFLFLPIGKLISSVYNSLKVAVGPLGNWLRVGDSFSKSSGVKTKAIRWGGNKHHRQKIGSDRLRNMNESLHNTRLPTKGWRTQDAGHLHLYRR